MSGIEENNKTVKSNGIGPGLNHMREDQEGNQVQDLNGPKRLSPVDDKGRKIFMAETAGARVAREFKKKAEYLQSQLMDQFDTEFNDIVDQCVEELEEPSGIKGKHTNLYDKGGRKIFIARESLLTELLEINHIKTIYNIFVALLIIFIINTLVYDYIEIGRISIDFSTLTWAFGKVPQVTYIWLMMLAYTLIAFPLFQAWIANRTSWAPVPLPVWALGYFIYMCTMIYFPIAEIVRNALPPASTIILVAEQVRLMMKIHAFVRENMSKVLEKSSEKGENVEEEKSDDYPGFSQYLYFLFIPTLIYRNSYPMTPSIRWHYVVSNVVQVIVCVFFTYYIFARFCVPIFRNTGKEPGNLRNLMLSTFSCMLPGTLVLVLAFFAILHSWLNAFAEMLRFADRMFYRDWWNATSYAAYYRMWNVVVHDWLNQYVYKDCLLFFGERSKVLAIILVFATSAVAHEYILILAFGFFYPVLFCLFGGVGLGFIFLKPGRTNPSSVWNIFMWVTLFLGNGLILCLYSQEWYASHNCPRKGIHLSEIFIPRSWSKDCVEWAWRHNKM